MSEILAADLKKVLWIRKEEIKAADPDVPNDRTSMNELCTKAIRDVNHEIHTRCDTEEPVIGSELMSAFMTDQDCMDISRAKLEKSDIICVLYGGSRSYPLRPTSNPDEF